MKNPNTLLRKIWRSRSRLLILFLTLIVIYALQQNNPDASENQITNIGNDKIEIHRRAVLQRANNTNNNSQQNNKSVLKTQESIKNEGDKNEIEHVLNTDVKRNDNKVTIPPTTTIDTITEKIEDYDTIELEDELENRRKRVKEVCEATGLDQKGEPNSWEFFIDHKHHLVWCNIFKAASSTWMYNFNLLAGYKEEYLRRSRKTPLVLARARFPRPSNTQLKEVLATNYMSFMIVRDPFERILSAYRNKIEAFRHKFYRKVARQMITKYRKPGSKFEGVKGPSFPEFIMYVIDTQDKPDEHWAPFYKFCTPCQVNFSIIAKLETLSRDQKYLINHAGISNELKRAKRGHHIEALNKARGSPTAELIEKYFKQLTLEQLLSLYRIYRIDFDMFDYDADKYFKLFNQLEPNDAFK